MVEREEERQGSGEKEAAKDEREEGSKRKEGKGAAKREKGRREGKKGGGFSEANARPHMRSTEEKEVDLYTQHAHA